MGTLGIILAVVFAVIHILSAIAKEAARKKEMQKRREAERLRQIQVGRPIGSVANGPATVPTAREPVFGPDAARTMQPVPLPTVPGRHTAGHPLDNLAARRKIQLEQMRQRQGGHPQTATDLFQPDHVDRDQRTIQEARARRVQQLKAEQKKREGQKKSRKQQTQTPKPAQRPSHLIEEPVPQVSTSSSQANEKVDVRLLLNNRTSLRHVFVLKELLDQPLALREP